MKLDQLSRLKWPINTTKIESSMEIENKHIHNDFNVNKTTDKRFIKIWVIVIIKNRLEFRPNQKLHRKLGVNEIATNELNSIDSLEFIRR